MTDEKNLRVSEVARLTGLSRKLIKELADVGELEATRIGRGKHRRFQRSAVAKYCRRVGLQMAAK